MIHIITERETERIIIMIIMMRQNNVKKVLIFYLSKTSLYDHDKCISEIMAVAGFSAAVKCMIYLF